MTQTLQDKEQIVSDISRVAQDAASIIAADYHHLTVAEMTELRVKARKQDVYMRVVKNTLARRALRDGPYQCLCDHFKGPLLLAFSTEDPGVAPRLFRDFMKEHVHLEVTMLAADGHLLESNDLERLANLPTREQAIAMLLGILKSPITRFARVLSAIPTQLVRTLAAVKQSKADAGTNKS